MDSIPVGKSLDGDASVELPLKTLTMHGLIGGSTGTGKSRAIQVMAEQLNDLGVPVFLADLKGDMSGFIKANSSEKVKGRARKLGMEYSPKSFPSNFFSVSGKYIPFRVRLDEVDSSLVARVLNLNKTQESNLKLAFLYAKKKKLPVRDLLDLKEILAYLSNNRKHAQGISTTSIGVIQRQLSIAVGEGLNKLFGEPSLEIQDILKPKINVLELGNWRKRSEFPSVLMAFVLYRLFHELEDVGSADKPRIVIFIDEAHYLFSKSNPALTDLFVTILKQIRSKGVGVFLGSQNPEDIPEKVLEQLGCKIQFALRAFTAEELKDVRGIAKSFPQTKKHDLSKEILELNIGEAFVSPLDKRGRPIIPVKAAILCPRSSMKVIPKDEVASSIETAIMERYRSHAPPERYDLKESMESISVEYRDSWSSRTATDAKYKRKQSRMASKQWKKLKSIGLFFLLFMLLLVIVLLLVFIILK